jgi:hypothetical protein
VVLTDEFIYPNDWPPELVVRSGGSRADVWRWMHASTAVVDLAPDPVLARDVLEAFLCGAPVIVPEGTLAARHADASGGGLSFRTAHDIRAFVGALQDGAVRGALGSRGRAYAEARFTDAASFEARVRSVVMGGARDAVGV